MGSCSLGARTPHVMRHGSSCTCSYKMKLWYMVWLTINTLQSTVSWVVNDETLSSVWNFLGTQFLGACPHRHCNNGGSCKLSWGTSLIPLVANIGIRFPFSYRSTGVGCWDEAAGKPGSGHRWRNSFLPTNKFLWWLSMLYNFGHS